MSESMRKAEDLLNAFKHGNIEEEKEVTKIKVSDPMVSMRMSLLSFFEKAFSAVEEEYIFRKKIRDAIETKIDIGDEEDPISTSQLIGLYKLLSDRTNDTLINILNTFRPAPEQNIFDQGSSSSSHDGPLGNLTAKDQESIDILRRFLDAMATKQRTDDEKDESN